MQKIRIHLEKVTEDNAEDIVKLRVAKDQKDYVASNDWSGSIYSRGYCRPKSLRFCLLFFTYKYIINCGIL